MIKTKYPYFLILLALFSLTFAVACGNGDNDGTQAQEAELTEENQSRLLAASPAPQLENSLEREQLKRRLTRFNTANKVSYMILMSDMGQIITSVPIRGKVSSVNSLLTTPDQIVQRRWRHTGGNHFTEHTVASPDLDGSYGSNGDAVFFFRASDDAYMEWNGKYFLSDVPVIFTTKPAFTLEEK